ncbi:phosphate permease [Chiua virens]|nr:phosphate permease [Chiua virens]
MGWYADSQFEERASSSIQSDERQDVVYLNERRRTALAEIDNASFSRFHVKVCLVAGIGFFTDAYDIFAIGIAATMLAFVYGSHRKDDLPAFTHWQLAGLKLATPAGNLIGQLLFGFLADTLGRKRMYGVELTIMIVATLGQAISGGGPGLDILGVLIFWRVVLGIGVGGDYPLSSIITSEFASTRLRGRMMTAVFAFQGWGQLAASLVALVVVTIFKDAIQHSTSQVDYAWRLLIGLGCIPAAIAVYFRLTVPETPRFTMDIDRHVGRAASDIKDALAAGRYTPYVNEHDIYESRVTAPRASKRDFSAHFSQWVNLKVLLGTAYSWFALDIAFYTLTLDNDWILGSVGFGVVPGNVYKSLHNVCIGNIIATAAGYIPGFAASFLAIDVWGRKPIQFMGFTILTILFMIMGFAYDHLSGTALIVLYCLANFFQNFGPNTTTFIIPGEVFPTRYRATSYGISAASGKLGAVIAQLLYAGVNATQDQQRLYVVWRVLSFVMLTGVFSTLLIPETNQRTLEDLSNEDQERYVMDTFRGIEGPAPWKGEC